MLTADAATWTTERVFLRLERAVDVFRALPQTGANIGRIRSCMPEALQSYWDAYGYDEARARGTPPVPQDIDDAEEAMLWFSWVNHGRAQQTWRLGRGGRDVTITIPASTLSNLMRDGLFYSACGKPTRWICEHMPREIGLAGTFAERTIRQWRSRALDQITSRLNGAMNGGL